MQNPSETYSRCPSEVEIFVSLEIEQDNAALSSFLNFLARNIDGNNTQIREMNCSLHDRIQNLVGEMNVDLDAPLSDADE